MPPARGALPRVGCEPTQPAHTESRLIGWDGIRNPICSDRNENLINSNVNVEKKQRGFKCLPVPGGKRQR